MVKLLIRQLCFFAHRPQLGVRHLAYFRAIGNIIDRIAKPDIQFVLIPARHVAMRLHRRLEDRPQSIVILQFHLRTDRQQRTRLQAALRFLRQITINLLFLSRPLLLNRRFPFGVTGGDLLRRACGTRLHPIAFVPGLPGGKQGQAQSRSRARGGRAIDGLTIEITGLLGLNLEGPEIKLKFVDLCFAQGFRRLTMVHLNCRACCFRAKIHRLRLCRLFTCHLRACTFLNDRLWQCGPLRLSWGHGLIADR